MVETGSVALAELGLTFLWSDSVDEASRLVRIKRPDLLLLEGDLLRAQPDLCSIFRQNKPETYLPILLLVPDQTDLSSYLCNSAVDDYMRLPLQTDELQSRVMLRLSAVKKSHAKSLPQIDFAFLASLSNLAIADIDCSEILRRAVNSISQIIEVKRCSITMIREDEEAGYVLASNDDEGVNGLRIDLERYPEIRETMANGQPLLIEDIHRHPLMESVLPYIEKLDFNSLLVLPMVDRQRIIGVLILRASRSIVGFTEEEISFCQLVANVATSALRMAEMRQAELVSREGRVDVEKDEENIRQRSSLLGMAAHDLRVLVSVIDGYCLLLNESEGDNLNPEQNEIMNGLMTGSRRLVDMANNLLDYSRIDAGRFDLKIQPHNLCDILKIVYSEVMPLLRKRSIRMEIDCLEDEVPVVCDEEGIRRVFYNIVSNALKFTPDGGLIRLQLKEDNLEVRVSVEDNGPGIEPSLLGSLFDEYSWSPSPYGHAGSGLGLSICKKIIEAHQGRIWAESSLGEGSRFIFCLPKSA